MYCNRIQLNFYLNRELIVLVDFIIIIEECRVNVERKTRIEKCPIASQSPKSKINIFILTNDNDFYLFLLLDNAMVFTGLNNGGQAKARHSCSILTLHNWV